MVEKTLNRRLSEQLFLTRVLGETGVKSHGLFVINLIAHPINDKASLLKYRIFLRNRI